MQELQMLMQHHRLHQTTAADPPELAKALDVPEAMRAVFNNTRSRCALLACATASMCRLQLLDTLYCTQCGQG